MDGERERGREDRRLKEECHERRCKNNEGERK